MDADLRGGSGSQVPLATLPPNHVELGLPSSLVVSGPNSGYFPEPVLTQCSLLLKECPSFPGAYFEGLDL